MQLNNRENWRRWQSESKALRRATSALSSPALKPILPPLGHTDACPFHLPSTRGHRCRNNKRVSVYTLKFLSFLFCFLMRLSGKTVPLIQVIIISAARMVFTNPKEVPWLQTAVRQRKTDKTYISGFDILWRICHPKQQYVKKALLCCSLN